MNRSRLPAPGDTVLALACLALALLAHNLYVTLVQPDVPYMDTMRMLVLQDAWRRGEMTWWDLWEPAAAHHGLISPLYLLANVEWFRLDSELASRTTGWVIAAVCGATMWTFLLDRKRALVPAYGSTDTVARFVAIALLPALFFSWAGFEVITLDLGVTLWVKNLCFILFFVAHAAWIRAPAPRIASTIALSVAGVVIVLAIGQGWSYAFVGSVIAVQLLVSAVEPRQRALAPHRWVLVVALLAAVLVYALAGRHAGVGARAPLAAASLLLPLYALGSAWVGSEAFLKSGGDEAVLLLAGTVTVISGAWGLYRRWRRGIASASLLPIHFMGYAALCALAFSVGRGGWGIHGVIAPRYYLDVVLFLVGTLWLLYEDAEARRDRLARISGAVCLAMAVVVAAGHVKTYRQEWATAPYRAIAFDRMEDALRRGAKTEADARLMQSHQPYAARAAAVLRARRLSIFAHDAEATCDAKAVQFGEGWNAPEGVNRWMRQEAQVDVPPCTCVATWHAFLPPSFPGRDLVVESEGTSTTLTLVPGKLTTVSLPAGATWRTTRLRVSRATLPSRDVPGSADKRTLGALFGPPAFQCVADAP